MKILCITGVMCLLASTAFADQLPFWKDGAAPDLSISPTVEKSSVFKSFASWDWSLSSSVLPLFNSFKPGFVIIFK